MLHGVLDENLLKNRNESLMGSLTIFVNRNYLSDLGVNNNPMSKWSGIAAVQVSKMILFLQFGKIVYLEDIMGIIW